MFADDQCVGKSWVIYHVSGQSDHPKGGAGGNERKFQLSCNELSFQCLKLCSTTSQHSIMLTAIDDNASSMYQWLIRSGKDAQADEAINISKPGYVGTSELSS